MGTLNVNTLKSETLTGKSVASSIAVTAEGGSITTNLQQGLGKNVGVIGKIQIQFVIALIPLD